MRIGTVHVPATAHILFILHVTAHVPYQLATATLAARRRSRSRAGTAPRVRTCGVPVSGEYVRLRARSREHRDARERPRCRWLVGTGIPRHDQEWPSTGSPKPTENDITVIIPPPVLQLIVKRRAGGHGSSLKKVTCARIRSHLSLLH
jgi:hypothetical protein